MVLERAYLLETMLPDVLADGTRWQLLPLQQFRVHAHHEHFFVMGTVENADAPALRKALGGPPQEVVLELLGAGLFERVHFAALRIDAGHHVLDDTVLANRIHALEHQQHTPLAVGVETLLQLAKPGDALRQNWPYVLDVGREAEGLGWVMIGQPATSRFIDPASSENSGQLHRCLAPRVAQPRYRQTHSRYATRNGGMA
jgi:hypothetical protein